MKPAIKTSKLFPVSIIITVLIAFILPASSCSQSSTLDGKKFAVTTMEKDKPETAVNEEIVFEGGNFDNLQCHEWGFTKGKCTTTKDGENYNFEAVTESPDEGKMTWKGMVMGDAIHGDMVWQKAGQADITYTFQGTAKN